MTPLDTDPRTHLLNSLKDVGLLIDGKCDIWDVDETLRILLEDHQSMRLKGLRPWEPYSRPLKVQIDFTNCCNLRCSFCYNDSGAKRVHELSESDLDGIFDELAEMQVCQIVLSGGEVFCRVRTLFRILERARSLRLGIRLVTNGWFIDDGIAAKLAAFPIVDVQVSIDGGDPVAHDRLRGRAGSWQHAVHGVAALTRNKVRASVACVLNARNWRTLAIMPELAIHLGARRLVFADLVNVGRATSVYEDLCLDDESYERSFETISDLRRRYRSRLDISMGTDMGVSMRFNVAINDTVCYIRPDGTVCPNCMIPVPFGDIHREPLAEIWSRMRGLWRHPEVLQLIDRFQLHATAKLKLTRSVFKGLPAASQESLI